MCDNVIKNTIRNLPFSKKVEFNIRLTLVRAAKRQRLWVAQDGKCHYCERETVLPKQGENNKGGLIATLDHIITQSNGGTDSLANMVVACYTCNNNRLDMDYHTFYTMMKTPGGWEAHKAELSREKALRDEVRRKESLKRHQETTAMEMAAHVHEIKELQYYLDTIQRLEKEVNDLQRFKCRLTGDWDFTKGDLSDMIAVFGETIEGMEHEAG